MKDEKGISTPKAFDMPAQGNALTLNCRPGLFHRGVAPWHPPTARAPQLEACIRILTDRHVSRPQMNGGDVFNNREIATGIWLLIFAALLLLKPPIRASFGSLIRAFVQWRILLSVGCMALYIAAVVACLWSIGFWRQSLVKDTVLWACLSGFAMVVTFVTSHNDDNVFKKIAVDNLRAIGEGTRGAGICPPTDLVAV